MYQSRKIKFNYGGDQGSHRGHWDRIGGDAVIHYIRIGRDVRGQSRKRKFKIWRRLGIPQGGTRKSERKKHRSSAGYRGGRGGQSGDRDVNN